jgi:hypothetical protein
MKLNILLKYKYSVKIKYKYNDSLLQAILYNLEEEKVVMFSHTSYSTTFLPATALPGWQLHGASLQPGWLAATWHSLRLSGVLAKAGWLQLASAALGFGGAGRLRASA